MSKPYASIIITTYNRSKILEERSLRSALNQSFKDYEIIVVDDCGSDDTGKIVLKHKNIRYFKLPVNQGLSAARNFGISKAKGKYVVCLDDDNELMPDFLKETILNIGTWAAIKVGRIIQYKDFADYAHPIFGKISSFDWGILFDKRVFDKIQYDEKMRANEDTDFGIQFYKVIGNKVGLINKPLTLAYDIDDPKLSLSYPNERELKGMAYFFEKNFKEYDEPKELWCLYRLMGRKFYRGGYRFKGINYFWQGFKSYKTFRAFLHFFFILLGWFVYDQFMTLEEKVAAKLRKK